MSRRIESWGRYPKAEHELLPLHWRSDPIAWPEAGSVLPHGLGRSYGDSCLNDGGSLLLTRGLSRFLDFDEESGVLTCEAGVSLGEILSLVLPRGWFLPVTPGTRFVTVGGAIANDVHGKNHVRDGSFGRFVEAFELVRSDGSRLVCSSEENAELFAATIGGLGLTGLVTWARIRLRKIAGPGIDQESVRLRNLEDFFRVDAESESDWTYTVAWIDCLAKGRRLGRGIYYRGNHEGEGGAVGAGPDERRATRTGTLFHVPFDAPSFLLNSWSIRAFNALYYRKQLRAVQRGRVHWAPFFYPLDAVGNWNRIYGKRGLLQWQCVVPDEERHVVDLLEEISRAREGSFLVVLKRFGSLPSPGLLSFPRPGLTLALDFPNRGARTFDLLDRLDRLVLDAGGALYPAKDARMSPELFRASFPAWQDFARHVDPAFSSSFWRRVTSEREPIEKVRTAAF